MEVKQEFQWGVAIITFKDLCDWLDYENYVGGKNGYSILLWKSFLIFPFPSSSKPQELMTACIR